jgi:hypothetical protein
MITIDLEVSKHQNVNKCFIIKNYLKIELSDNTVVIISCYVSGLRVWVTPGPGTPTGRTKSTTGQARVEGRSSVTAPSVNTTRSRQLTQFKNRNIQIVNLPM